MEPGETWEECQRKVQPSLSEELDRNDVVIERGHRVKAYSPEKKKSKKLRSRIRGRHNGRSMDMTGQILLFVHPGFSVITEMTGHFFLEQLEKISLEIP